MSFFTAASNHSPVCANDNESIAAFLLDIKGQAAALQGLPMLANPYADQSFEAACWTTGWMAGQREMVEAVPERRVARARHLAVAEACLYAQVDG